MLLLPDKEFMGEAIIREKCGTRPEQMSDLQREWMRQYITTSQSPGRSGGVVWDGSENWMAGFWILLLRMIHR